MQIQFKIFSVTLTPFFNIIIIIFSSTAVEAVEAIVAGKALYNDFVERVFSMRMLWTEQGTMFMIKAAVIKYESTVYKWDKYPLRQVWVSDINWF